MKRIVLITLASLTLFATAATAHQNGWGYNHMRGNRNNHQTNYNSRGCPMNGNWTNQGMMRSAVRRDTTPANQSNNWRTNPSYQGQAYGTGTTTK